MKFSKPLLITKLKATGVHLSLSVVVFIYLAYKIFYDWYPQPYFSIDGGWQGIRLIGAVDLVLGPFITFLIFNLNKTRRAIIFDLAVIMAIQFGALAYGIQVTYSQRPVAIVLIDEFMVSAIMRHYGDGLTSESELKKFSDEKPPIIYARLEKNAEALAEMNRIKIEDKILEHAQLGLYRPQSELAKALQERQMIFMDRLDFFKDAEKFEAWLQQNHKSTEEVLIARFSGRYGNRWLVFDLDGRYRSYF